MTALVVGLGSMGRRRIRILKRSFPHVGVVGFDINAARREAVAQEYGIPTVEELGKGLATAELVFVCTSPQYHRAVFEHIDLSRYHTFSELDLVTDGYTDLLKAERASERRHFLSSTPLYGADAGLVSSLAANRGTLAYRYHVGQYLPDWHPWEDYRAFFAGQAATNGCREILGIEIPWLESAFGNIVGHTVVKQRLSKLNIDFPDVLSISFTHESGTQGQVLVDVVSPVPVRQVEIFAENFYVLWNGKPNSVQVWNSERRSLETRETTAQVAVEAGYADFIVENPYVEEVGDFLAGIQDPGHVFRYSYEKSARCLQLIDAIEGAE